MVLAFAFVLCIVLLFPFSCLPCLFFSLFSVMYWAIRSFLWEFRGWSERFDLVSLVCFFFVKNSIISQSLRGLILCIYFVLFCSLLFFRLVPLSFCFRPYCPSFFHSFLNAVVMARAKCLLDSDELDLRTRYGS